MDWTDVTQAVASVISAGAAVFVFVSIRQAARSISDQNEASDTATVLSIWEKLDEHWCRFRLASEDDKKFEFGQLISYYEMSCGLFRDGVFKAKAAITLYEHLFEILPDMRGNDSFKAMFDDLKSTPETFENIDWICKRPKHIFRRKYS